jgi:hypothetical protein
MSPRKLCRTLLFPIFKDQAAQFVLDRLLEDGKDRLSQNIGNYQSKLPNISRRAGISLTLLQKPEITHLIAVAVKGLL